MTGPFRSEEELRYEDGEVRTYVDGAIREAIKVRAGVVDDLVRRAIIMELEALGYVVTPPKDQR
jgi:hypothetical protein